MSRSVCVCVECVCRPVCVWHVAAKQTHLANDLDLVNSSGVSLYLYCIHSNPLVCWHKTTGLYKYSEPLPQPDHNITWSRTAPTFGRSLFLCCLQRISFQRWAFCLHAWLDCTVATGTQDIHGNMELLSSCITKSRKATCTRVLLNTTSRHTPQATYKCTIIITIQEENLLQLAIKYEWKN